MATTDSNGVLFYETTDPVSPLQVLLNLGQTSVSNALNSRIRLYRSTSAVTPTTPTPVQGDFWYQTDNNSVWTYNGSAWRPFMSAALRRWDTGVDLLPTFTQYGVARTPGLGGQAVTAVIPFPLAFAGGSIPHVSTNILGYRATGGFDPNGLTATATEPWVSKAYGVSSAGANLLVWSPTVISAGFDIYVSWSATGLAG